MQWLNELPFADNRVLQIGFLAACGIAALIVLAIVYRLTFAHRLRVPGGRTRQPRLGLVDAFSLDGQRQLVLVRRDNVEHLVMIGGPNDVLVESQINRAVASARESNQASSLLGPSAPVRRTEAALAASAAAEAPKVAAKAPASAPVPAPAASTAATAAPPIPKAPAPLRLAARAAPGSPNRGAADPEGVPPPPKRPFLPKPPRRSKRPRPNCRAQPPPRRRRRQQLSSPDQCRRLRRPRVRRTRVPHSRVRRCPRRSSPLTPRRAAARFAPRKRLPREGRPIRRPRLLPRPRRSASRRKLSR